MIHKSELKNKYVKYFDKDGKIRVDKVVNINGNTLTVLNAYKERHRVNKDKVLGRQYRKRGLEGIDWCIRRK